MKPSVCFHRETQEPAAWFNITIICVLSWKSGYICAPYILNHTQIGQKFRPICSYQTLLCLALMHDDDAQFSA